MMIITIHTCITLRYNCQKWRLWYSRGSSSPTLSTCVNSCVGEPLPCECTRPCVIEGDATISNDDRERDARDGDGGTTCDDDGVLPPLCGVWITNGCWDIDCGFVCVLINGTSSSGNLDIDMAQWLQVSPWCTPSRQVQHHISMEFYKHHEMKHDMYILVQL